MNHLRTSRNTTQKTKEFYQNQCWKTLIHLYNYNKRSERVKMMINKNKIKCANSVLGMISSLCYTFHLWSFLNSFKNLFSTGLSFLGLLELERDWLCKTPANLSFVWDGQILHPGPQPPHVKYCLGLSLGQNDPAAEGCGLFNLGVWLVLSGVVLFSVCLFWGTSALLRFCFLKSCWFKGSRWDFYLFLKVFQPHFLFQYGWPHSEKELTYSLSILVLLSLFIQESHDVSHMLMHIIK